jgi:hypothetical protein
MTNAPTDERLARAVDALRAAEQSETQVQSGKIPPFSEAGRAIAARYIAAREQVIAAAKAWQQDRRPKP